jgi:hypothetical protein
MLEVEDPTARSPAFITPVCFVGTPKLHTKPRATIENQHLSAMASDVL